MSETREPIQIIQDFQQDCIRCGFCTRQCDLLNKPALNLGQIAEALQNGQPTVPMIDYAQLCSLCRYCTRECPAELNAADLARAARAHLIELGYLSLEGFEPMFVDGNGDAFAYYRQTYGIDYRDLKREHYDVLFFPGCSLGTYGEPLTRAAYQWLQGEVEKQGQTLGFLECCCGEPLGSLGLLKRKADWQSQLLEQVRAAGAKRVVTVCGNCHNNMLRIMDGLEVVSLYQLLAQAGRHFPENQLFTIHDSCPDRDLNVIGTALRQMAPAGQLVEMEHHGRDTICCGSGGVMPAVAPAVGLERAQQRVDEFKQSGADCVVTSCMACSRRFSRVAQPGQVRHCLELIFGIQIDYEKIAHNLATMWSDE